jgi:hypothetical protein
MTEQRYRGEVVMGLVLIIIGVVICILMWGFTFPGSEGWG